jgi:hypothetical protein
MQIKKHKSSFHPLQMGYFITKAQKILRVQSFYGVCHVVITCVFVGGGCQIADSCIEKGEKFGMVVLLNLLFLAQQ